MTRMMATGVNQARILVCKAVAPVINGDACPRAIPGRSMTAAISDHAGRRDVRGIGTRG
jgi:hypothetical protein